MGFDRRMQLGTIGTPQKYLRVQKRECSAPLSHFPLLDHTSGRVMVRYPCGNCCGRCIRCLCPRWKYGIWLPESFISTQKTAEQQRQYVTYVLYSSMIVTVRYGTIVGDIRHRSLSVRRQRTAVNHVSRGTTHGDLGLVLSQRKIQKLAVASQGSVVRAAAIALLLTAAVPLVSINRYQYVYFVHQVYDTQRAWFCRAAASAASVITALILPTAYLIHSYQASNRSLNLTETRNHTGEAVRNSVRVP